MDKYRYMGHKIGQYRCVSLNDHDRTLAGARGEIWEASPTHCKAIEVNGGESEKIIVFENKDLLKWVKRLQVPLRPEDQAYWANNPNARLKAAVGKESRQCL